MDNPPSTLPFPPGTTPNSPPEFTPIGKPLASAPSDTPDTKSAPIVADSGTPQYGQPPFSPDQFGPNWYWGEFDGRYEVDQGVLSIPVSGGGSAVLTTGGSSGSGGSSGPTQAAIIRVHDPIGYRVVEWTVERIGAQPQAPSANTNNPNEVLARAVKWPLTPGTTADGIPIYRLSGRYEYLLIIPPQETDTLSTGVPPWSGLSPSQTNVPPSTWNQQYLNSSDSVPAGFSAPPSAG